MMGTDIAVGSGLKVTCDRDELVAKLATVSRVVSSRGSVQVLSGVLLRPTEGGLELARHRERLRRERLREVPTPVRMLPNRLNPSASLTSL